MSARARLPNRRASTSFCFEVGGLRYTAHISKFADGSIGEVFIQNTKPGSQSDSNARDAAIVCSLALQFGVPMQTIRKALLRDGQGHSSTPLGRALDIIGGEP